MSNYLKLTRDTGRNPPEFVIVRADAIAAFRKCLADDRIVVTLTGGSLLYVTEDVPTIAAMLGLTLAEPLQSNTLERAI